MAEFVKLFENLQGKTVGERKKNLFLLLKQDGFKQNQDEILKNLVPKNYLEHLFYIDTLIYLRRTTELLKILKEGNDVYVSKIVKEIWFFKEAFNIIKPQDFVNQCLPEMSYSVRMKTLKKLFHISSEEQSDALFKAVLDRYGLFLALNFLPFCSVATIKKTIEMEELKLHAGHLQLFLKKDPELVINYFDKFGHGIKNKNKFLKYVALHNLEFFLKLIRKYDNIYEGHVGVRTTKRIIDLNRQDVINHPEKYEILKKSVIPRKLHKDFRTYFLNVCSKRLSNFPNQVSCINYLKFVPVNIKFTLIADTYKILIKSDMKSNSVWMENKDILDYLFLVDPEGAAKFAMINYQKSNNNSYLKHLPINISIPMLKEKINLTSSISDRSKLIDLMVLFCKFHKDLNALEEVMTYFCKRHRNDDYNTRKSFLNTVLRCFKYEDFNDKHFTCLMDLKKIHKMKNEYESNDILYSYLEFLYKNGKPYKEVLDAFVEETIEDGCYFNIVDQKVGEVLKIALLELFKQIPIQKKEDYVLEDARLFLNFFEFNKKFPEMEIDIWALPRLVNAIQNFKTSDASWDLIKCIEKMICKKNRKPYENVVKDLYFEDFGENSYNNYIVDWFFNFEIAEFAKHFDNILLYIPTKGFDSWYTLNKYSHLNLDIKTVEFLKQQFGSEQKAQDKIKYVIPLVKMLPPDEYIKFIEPYLPKSEKVDLEDKEARDLYNLQCCIAESLKNVHRKSAVLDTITKFAIGDYLKAILGPLYSASRKVPENQIYAAIETLGTKAVSVRKHSLFLARDILEKKVVIEKLKKFGSEEKNISIQKHLYTCTMKYFILNPCEETLNLVKTFINFIDKFDDESLTNLSQCKVPKKCKPIIWQWAWEYFYANQKVIITPEKYMNEILSLADQRVIEEIPIELSQKIIMETFLNKESALMSNNGILQFVVMFLVYEKRVDPFSLVFNIVSNYKTNHWHNTTDKNIQLFFDEFTGNVNSIFFTSSLIVKFCEFWESMFTPVEAFKQYAILKQIKMYKENSENLESYAKNVIKFVEESYTIYGPLIIFKLAAHVKYINNILLSDNFRIQFVKYLLKFKTSIAIDILILQFVDVFLEKDKYEILNFLSQNDNISFQILYNSQLRD
ncbi:unnamed protein product [Brassicogethes aeneus]|uniref:Uncharacterized protein n=1 Tax=Brassicogethes aeneus TaxID=1431903 RepID=A0A9P0B105_BRAAE|nr:unnamed protein product [Brassicogethes aeneus]